MKQLQQFSGSSTVDDRERECRRGPQEGPVDMATQQLKPADVKTHELSCLEICGAAVFVQARLPLTSSRDAVHQGAAG